LNSSSEVTDGILSDTEDGISDITELCESVEGEKLSFDSETSSNGGDGLGHKLSLDGI
jgi:hypothetical protein